MAAHEGRVSPVLDVAGRLLVVEVEAGREVERREEPLAVASMGARVEAIRKLGIAVLICGAVSWPLEAALVANGVKVVSQICGPLDGVLATFLSGRLSEGAYLMPGCCGRRRQQGGRGAGARRGWGHQTSEA